MSKIFIIIALFWTISFSAFAKNYSVVEKNTIKYPTKGINSVEINCYCSTNISINSGEYFEATIEASLSSLGYHGYQETPSSIGQALMHFVESREGNKLILTSKENTYIHHSFIIEKLSIKLPKDIKLTFNPIKYRALEGRDIE
jgi:hypothetical protein